MAHLTEAEFKKLTERLATMPKGAKVATGTPAPRRQKGRDRLARITYDDSPVVFELELGHDPRPKERPRTVSDMRAIESAFLAARGNLAAFRSMLSQRGISRTFTPKGTKDYEDLIAVEARRAMGSRQPLKCPVEVSMVFVLKGEEGLWPTSAADGDGDNLEKAVLDALNKVVFEDDRQVVKSTREKRCGPSPRLIISVSPASP